MFLEICICAKTDRRERVLPGLLYASGLGRTLLPIDYVSPDKHARFTALLHRVELQTAKVWPLPSTLGSAFAGAYDWEAGSAQGHTCACLVTYLVSPLSTWYPCMVPAVLLAHGVGADRYHHPRRMLSLQRAANRSSSVAKKPHRW